MSLINFFILFVAILTQQSNWNDLDGAVEIYSCMMIWREY